MVFHRTSAQTDGEEVFVEVTVHPHGFVAAAHVHPYQTERFEVLQGRLGLRLGDEQLVATRRGLNPTVPAAPSDLRPVRMSPSTSA